MGPVDPQPPRPGPTWAVPWPAIAVAIALAGTTIGVYASTVGYGFVNWDDPLYVYENPHVLSGLRWDEVEWAFSEQWVGYRIPLTWLSLQGDATIWGKDPAGYHLTNVLLHAIDTAVFYLLLRQMTGSTGRSAAAALLWALHPLHVESVAWVTERKDVLSGLFGLLAIWAYVGYVRSRSDGWLAAVFFLQGCGIAAKPMLVTLPFGLLLLDAWPLNRLRRPADLVPLAREKLPLFLLSFAAVLVTVQTQTEAMSDADAVPISYRVTTVVMGYVRYLGMTFWPTDLAGFYPYRTSPRPVWQPAAAAALLLALTAGAVALRRRAPYLLVGWLWFLGTLLPVSGLLQSGAQELADRFTYWPHLLLFVAIVWAAADATRWLGNRAGGVLRVVLAIASVLACAALSRQQMTIWQDGRSLWGRTVAQYPDNLYAWVHLGDAYLAANDKDEAVRCYDQCLRMNPECLSARVNRSIALGTLQQ